MLDKHRTSFRIASYVRTGQPERRPRPRLALPALLFGGLNAEPKPRSGQGTNLIVIPVRPQGDEAPESPRGPAMRWLIQTLFLSWVLSSKSTTRRVSVRPEPKSTPPAALIVSAPTH